MKTWLLLLFLLSFAGKAEADFRIVGQEKITIPFQFVNNIIVLPIIVNGVELHFVLDSGVGATLLFSLDNKEINFNNIEKIKFTGLGGQEAVEGLRSSNNKVSVAGNFVDTSHQISIILDEDFNISSHIGIAVNGIIGYDFFKNYPVEIDYVAHKIYIFKNTGEISNLHKYESLYMAMDRNKPYVQATLLIQGKVTDAKMLIDIGNSDALWIFPKAIAGFQYQGANIEDYLGRGFNGDIKGKRGRIGAVSLGKYTLRQPIAAMPYETSIQSMSLSKGRVGSIGTEILSRFSVILDYPGNRFYFKKNRFFNYPFKYNMSGLDIKHDGVQWAETQVKMELESPYQPKGSGGIKSGTEVFKSPAQFQYKFELKPAYTIAGVRKGSPGADAGLQAGDQVLAIKNIPTTQLSLQDIYQLLALKEDKTISIEVKREGKVLLKYVLLKDPIPYTEY